jgi:hypothetical protein
VETKDRQFVLDKLASSEARLLELVQGLTPAQWRFHESPERWSIAEIIDHVILFEDFISQAIEQALEKPVPAEKRSQTADKDPLLIGLATSRRTRFNAREAVRPGRSRPEPSELVAQLRKVRARTVAFAESTQSDVRDHYFPHIAFGDLDCYQWLVVLGQHAARHAAQIEEIKAHRLFPVD